MFNLFDNIGFLFLSSIPVNFISRSFWWIFDFCVNNLICFIFSSPSFVSFPWEWLNWFHISVFSTLSYSDLLDCRSIIFSLFLFSLLPPLLYNFFSIFISKGIELPSVIRYLVLQRNSHITLFTFFLRVHTVAFVHLWILLLYEDFQKFPFVLLILIMNWRVVVVTSSRKFKAFLLRKVGS